MPYAYTINSASRLVTVRAEGHCDFASTVASMRELAADPAFRPGFRILVDLRAADYTPTAAEARAIAALQAAPDGLHGHPIAIVATKVVDYGMANMVAALAGNRGASVRAFQSVEEAMGWLDPVGAPESKS